MTEYDKLQLRHIRSRKWKKDIRELYPEEWIQSKEADANEDGYSEELLDRLWDITSKIFITSGFSVAISFHELDDIITTRNNIVIKQTVCSVCFEKEESENECLNKYYQVKCKKMTYKNVLLELDKQNFSIDCNHIFVESIDEIEPNLGLFELGCGS